MKKEKQAQKVMARKVSRSKKEIQMVTVKVKANKKLIN
jgi:hypothetical protein